MPRRSFPAIILATLASTHLVSAQWWASYSGSCASWEGQFGTTDGTHGTAILSASCYTPTGALVDSTLDLNTCIGRTGDATIEYPSSGLFDACIVLNVPNSLYNPFSTLQWLTNIEISCIVSTPGVVDIITLDLNDFVGNDNGVLICGFS